MSDQHTAAEEKLEEKTAELKAATQKQKSKIKAMKEEFVGFLWENSVMGLAIGVIIGGSVNTFVQSLVNGVLTPLIQLVIPSNTFKDLSYTYNGVTFVFGPLISAFLNFLLVALIIFLAIKYFLFKGGKIERDKITRT